MTDSIIFVPPGQASRQWLNECADYCARHKYTVKHVVTNWDDVVRLLKMDSIEVIVVARREHLPPDRPWRIESATEPARDDPPERRRPTRR